MHAARVRWARATGGATGVLARGACARDGFEHGCATCPTSMCATGRVGATGMGAVLGDGRQLGERERVGRAGHAQMRTGGRELADAGRTGARARSGHGFKGRIAFERHLFHRHLQRNRRPILPVPSQVTLVIVLIEIVIIVVSELAAKLVLVVISRGGGVGVGGDVVGARARGSVGVVPLVLLSPRIAASLLPLVALVAPIASPAPAPLRRHRLLHLRPPRLRAQPPALAGDDQHAIDAALAQLNERTHSALYNTVRQREHPGRMRTRTERVEKLFPCCPLRVVNGSIICWRGIDRGEGRRDEHAYAHTQGIAHDPRRKKGIPPQLLRAIAATRSPNAGKQRLVFVLHHPRVEGESAASVQLQVRVHLVLDLVCAGENSLASGARGVDERSHGDRGHAHPRAQTGADSEARADSEPPVPYAALSAMRCGGTGVEARGGQRAFGSCQVLPSHPHARPQPVIDALPPRPRGTHRTTVPRPKIPSDIGPLTRQRVLAREDDVPDAKTGRLSPGATEARGGFCGAFTRQERHQ
ncbi:hypothetical protein K438DRAFT_2020631 [Mycena galopus ATCC 62051]|nr:hypothetical protein K438DRAFT_2020631 [Mycena galopus ATCC 62051]